MPSSQQDARLQTRATASLLALLGALWFYAVAPDDFSFDSVAYAITVRDGGPLFHPHHLLYEPVVFVIARLLARFGVAFPELGAARIHNGLWAIGGAFALVMLMTAVTGRRLVGFLAGALLVISAGAIVFSTQNDAYVPTLACTVILLSALYGLDADPRPMRHAAAGLAWALATLYHQTGILLAAPVLYLCLAERGWPRGARSFFAIAIPAGLLTLSVYLVGFAIDSDAPTAVGFGRFVFRYLGETGFWGTSDNLTLHELYRAAASQTLVFVDLPQNKILRLGVVGAFLSAIMCCVHVASGSAARLAQACLVGALTFLLFNWWWLPTEPELAVIPLAFYVIILACGMAAAIDAGAHHAMPQLVPTLVAASVGFVAVWNAATIAHSAMLVGPEPRQIAARLAALEPRQCIILEDVVAGSDLQYFFHRQWIYWRDFMLDYYEGRDAASLPLVKNAPCLITRAQWFDPRRGVYRYSGDSRPEAWRRAVLALLAENTTGSTIRAWNARAWQDPMLGRLVLISHDGARNVPADAFWRDVATELLGR